MKVGRSLPYGSVIFCDDIRHELGGKRSLMGTYDSEMTFPSPAPAVLPTFCALIAWRYEIGETMGPMSFILFKDLPGRTVELFKADVDIPLSEHPVVQNPADPNGQTFAQILFEAKFASLDLESDCFLRMRAFRGEEEHRIGSLRVKFAASPEHVA